MRHWSVWIGIAFLIALCSSYALPVEAQSVSISGPSLGFVTSSKGTTIWPLLGILGATVPGEAWTLPQSVTNARISPRHNYALAIADEGSQPVVLDLDGSNPPLVPLAGARANPSVIAISPSGAAAALYDKESKRIQRIAGLPAEGHVVSEFDASIFEGDVRALAVSDDATLVLANVGVESRTLWLIDGKNSATPVPASEPSQVTFVAGRYDALIADDATQEVFMLQGLDQNPVRVPGIVVREERRPFSAIGVSADGQSIFVAQQGSDQVTVTNLETRTTAVVSCHCEPTVFFPLKGNAVFRLNGLGNGPITVLDAGSSTPRTLIIPIDPESLAGKAGAQ